MKNKWGLEVKPNTICAIDASTNSLAFAYFKNDNLEKYGKIKFFGNDIYEKIADTTHKTQAFFKQFDSLEHIIIEQPIYLNSPKTAANLSMSHGALVGSASLAGARKMASVSPMQWQNWIGNKKLTNEEKLFLTNIFRFFTQGDIDVAGGYVRNYLPYFPQPEIRMMLMGFAAREALHIAAYSHLIETLGMPEATYGEFLEYQSMRDKHEYFVDII
jgi:hypothetical protein